MLRFMLRAVLVVAVVVFFLFLIRPAFIFNAGNTFLNSVGSSTAYGSAQVVPDTQGNGGNLQINLQGLTSRFSYVITLDQGQCGGPILKTFSNVVSDNNGNISNTFSLADIKSATQPGVWINVHTGNSPQGPSVACGQVQTNNSLLTQGNSSTITAYNNTDSVSTVTVGSTYPTPTPVPTSAPTPTPTLAPSTGTFGDSFDFRNSSMYGSTQPGGFPQTGVAPPQGGNSYSNYTYPMKH